MSRHHLSQPRREVGVNSICPKPRPFNQSFLHGQKSGCPHTAALHGSRTSVSPGGRTRLPTHHWLLKTRTDGQTDETGHHPSPGFKPRPRKTRNHAPKRSYSEPLQGHSERSAVTAGAPRGGWKPTKCPRASHPPEPDTPTGQKSSESGRGLGDTPARSAEQPMHSGAA